MADGNMFTSIGEKTSQFLSLVDDGIDLTHISSGKGEELMELK